RVGRTEREEVVRNVPRPTTSSDTPRLPIPNGTGNRVIIAANRTTAPVSEETSKATLVSRNFAPPELEAYVPEPLDVEITELTGVTEDLERERPGKPQRVKPTRPTIEPPEVVQVEMSDLEKETYAWMGISPLVKLGRELVNPKTAIINVVPIGTLPLELTVVADPTPTAVETEDSPDLDSTESVPGGDTDDFVIPVVMEEVSSEVVEVVDIPVVTEVAEPVVETPVVDEVVEIAKTDTVEVPTPIVDEPEELPENRRRKRRSSATVD
ncbi:MAG: ribonuclease E/G, partial [Chamaesiphon sp.]|nr:ribonuclease E/G [Chamaesiphon sp.]